MTRLLELIRATVRGLSVFLLLMLILTPLAQIVMRGVFGVPMSGAEELARYFLICLSFLAASYVTRDGGQICMEELQAMLPEKLRWLIQLRMFLLALETLMVLIHLVRTGRANDTTTNLT